MLDKCDLHKQIDEVLQLNILQYTVEPPNTAALETGEKTAVLEYCGKGVGVTHITKKKTCFGLENDRR